MTNVTDPRLAIVRAGKRTVMHTPGLTHEAHRDVIAALRRAEHTELVDSARPSDLVKLAALVCIGAGVAFGGVPSMMAFGSLGGLALWLAFRHDDARVSREVDTHFDEATGLPRASSMDIVLCDELIASSLLGRIAVVAVEVPEIGAREVAGEPEAADALMVSVIHRLQSQGWIDRVAGPFGPLLFLRRPGVFFIVLRDVIDDRTTRWLASRLVGLVNRPVRWHGEDLDPRAVVGVAVGRSADRLELVRQANDARKQARRHHAGTVVSNVAGIATPAGGSLVSVRHHSTVAPLISPPAGSGEMFADAADLLRAVDRAATLAAETGERCFVRASATALCHWKLPAGVAARLNAAGAHGRIGLLIPSDLTHRGVRIAWRNIEKLRALGVATTIARSAEDEAAGRIPISGVDAGDVVAEHRGSRVTPPGSERTVSGGQSAQFPQETVTAVR